MSFRYGESKEKVINNREKFLGKLGLGLDDCVSMVIEDDKKISLVGKDLKGRGMENPDEAVETDCLVTQDKNVFLWLIIADCLPITFYNKNPFVLALAHLSRKTTDLKLTQEVVSLLESLGLNPEEIIVAIGPAIHKESYLFKESDNLPQKNNPEWKQFIKKTNKGLLSVDLIGYNKTQLLSAGVLEGNIFVSEIDTGKSEQFFSHHQAKQLGLKESRFAAVVGVKE